MIILAGLSLELAMLCGTPGGMNTLCAKLGMHRLAVHLPLAFALQHVEGFLLNTMHV